MREIKFRAWDKRRKQIREVISIQYFQKPLPELGAVHMVPEEDTIDNENMNFHSDIQLMQYTGLQDKNGVDIYEGDVVNLGFRDEHPYKWIYEPGVIRWWMTSAAFKWFSLKEDPSDANNYWLQQAYSSTREVIGNIYENPELLEQSNA